MPTFNQKNLRKGRYSEANQIYHITTTIANRQPLFNEFYLARKIINTIKQSDTLG